MFEDDIDKRKWMRTQPSYGPDWDFAIEYGIDISLIEAALLRERVQFVLVGGVAAIAHGSSYWTKNLDVVAPLSAENCGRILSALAPFEVRFEGEVLQSVERLIGREKLDLSTTLGNICLRRALPPVGGDQVSRTGPCGCSSSEPLALCSRSTI